MIPWVGRSVRIEFKYPTFTLLTLETGESLTNCGVDSISFAQIRGKVMIDLKIEIPMTFLSETYTIQDMIQHVEKKYKSLWGL